MPIVCFTIASQGKDIEGLLIVGRKLQQERVMADVNEAVRDALLG